MATVCVIGPATCVQQEVVGLRKEIHLKNSSSAPDSVAVGGSLDRSNHRSIRAQQVGNRPPVRPAVSFPLFPRNMDAYIGVSGQSTAPVILVGQELDKVVEEEEEEEEGQQKKKRVPIPALNIVMRSDLGVVMERRW